MSTNTPRRFQVSRPINLFVAADEILSDMRRVAGELGQDGLTFGEYHRLGKFHPSTAQRRFGDWSTALEHAGLRKKLRYEPSPPSNLSTPVANLSEVAESSSRKSSAVAVPAEELLTDMKRVALELGQDWLTVDQYDRLGKYDASTARRRFGDWSKALHRAGLRKLRHQENARLSDEALYANLAEVWSKLGRQPSSLEMRAPLSRYEATVYKRRFGKWMTALDAFASSMNTADATVDVQSEPIKRQSGSSSVTPDSPRAQAIGHQKAKFQRQRVPRTANYRLRWKVLQRDNFKCVSCGRSPASDPVTFEIDHIKAWANGGETLLENLQTLCSRCNLGKSNLGA